MSQQIPVAVETKVDPITLQVMTNAIYSVADEIVATLIRTSYSTNIKDRRDCSGAVFHPRVRSWLKRKSVRRFTSASCCRPCRPR